MRISDWSSDVCSSDLAFTSALNGASSCSERKRLDHSSSALERRTLQPGSSKMPWVSQSVKGLNGAGGGASMIRPSPHAAATEDVPFCLFRLLYPCPCLFVFSLLPHCGQSTQALQQLPPRFLHP